MRRSIGPSSLGRRLGLVSLLVLVAVVVTPSVAEAAVSVTRASLSSSGALSVEGRGVGASTTVTVVSPESTASGRADKSGRFKVSASGYRSSTCKATVSDGSTSAVVTLAGCTPTGATPPPPPTSSAQLTPVSAELGPGYVGSDFVTFASTGATITFGPGTVGPVRFEIIAGRLPAGLQLTDPYAGDTPAKSIRAAVTGTPTAVETVAFTIKATDANGLQASRTYSITINPSRTLDIVPQTWATVTVGSFTNLWFEGAGGVKPYRWAVTSGALPPGTGLIQDNPDGYLVRVSGTPTTRGTYTFTLRLTDAQAATVSRTFSVTVS
jgi:hypothetical protein